MGRTPTAGSGPLRCRGRCTCVRVRRCGVERRRLRRSLVLRFSGDAARSGARRSWWAETERRGSTAIVARRRSRFFRCRERDGTGFDKRRGDGNRPRAGRSAEPLVGFGSRRLASRRLRSDVGGCASEAATCSLLALDCDPGWRVGRRRGDDREVTNALGGAFLVRR